MLKDMPLHQAGTTGNLEAKPACLVQPLDGEGGIHGVASRQQLAQGCPSGLAIPVPESNSGGPEAFRRESQATFCLYCENVSFPFSVPLSATIAARTEGDVEGPVGLPGERAGVGAHSSEEGGLGPRGWRPEGTNRGQRPGQ